MPKWIKKATKMIINIFEKSLKNHPKWSQNPSKSVPGGVLRGSWGHLGSRLEVWGLSWRQSWRSWADLGSQMGGPGPILVPSWRPKCSKNRSGGDPIGDLFGVHLGQRCWVRFYTNLAPIWIPKPSQNGATLGSTSIFKNIDCRVVFWRMLAWFSMIIVVHVTWTI